MWYRIPAYEALWPLLDEINAELDAKMEQALPTYPGIIGSGQCAKCLSFQADFERVSIENESLYGQCQQISRERDEARQMLKLAHEQIDEQQRRIDQLTAEKQAAAREQCNADYVNGTYSG